MRLRRAGKLYNQVNIKLFSQRPCDEVIAIDTGIEVRRGVGDEFNGVIEACVLHSPEQEILVTLAMYIDRVRPEVEDINGHMRARTGITTENPLEIPQQAFIRRDSFELVNNLVLAVKTNLDSAFRLFHARARIHKKRYRFAVAGN